MKKEKLPNKSEIVNNIKKSQAYKKFVTNKRNNFKVFQTKIILDRLMKDAWTFVPLPEIMVIWKYAIAQYNARIFELRNYWFNIINEYHFEDNDELWFKVKHSFYKIID